MGDTKEIRELADLGLMDGVTTNPSLVKKAGRPFKELIAEICEITDGPVSAEVAALDYDTMLAEGRTLAKIAPNVVVKVPLTLDGLKTCRTLAEEGTPSNVTLCFSANQALLAAKAGAAYISPFLGRLDDVGRRRRAADPRNPHHLRQLRLRDRNPRRLDPLAAARHRRARLRAPTWPRCRPPSSKAW